ncbi:ATP-binding cassette domain-containing protein [Halorarum halophilum]|uniref:ATP-binding cassette domain-containing protein n=1 Tax=Halorarum halophilum TaxID=2743090 RepID=A0A7D5KEP4_9EURY|nr:oligopeptide/dipeptide ABC transporter ATP-binding protein [Halobaculum halophilum]QLG26976.1 ATP-binding cassette domain-containing protein [Halobaculum halophilum]
MSRSDEPGTNEEPGRSGANPASTDDVETVVEVRDLKKHYEDEGFLTGDPVRAVDGVSFDVYEGETLGLVGESGCGKTTLGRTILGLESVTAGSVSADGRDVASLSGTELREWQRDAQMVFQDPDSSLNDRMTVGEIIREPLDAHDWRGRPERRERVFDLIERVGLNEEHYYRYPHQFSGGQRQRVGIARALALEPEFIVLDEPVSALDVSVQARIINLLEELQEELGLTYLFIAHDLSVVRHIADRVAVMYLGNVVELGRTEEVYADPAHPYTISLLSAIPGSIAETDRERVVLRGAPPSPRDPPRGCPFVTRCPAKVRPDEFADLPEGTWNALDALHSVLRERSGSGTGLTERLKRSLGLSVGDGDIDEIVDDLFAGVTLTDDADAAVEDALEFAREGEDAEAVAALRDTFGSVCNREHPHPHVVDDSGRTSRCVRHEEGYDSPAEVVDRRLSRPRD